MLRADEKQELRIEDKQERLKQQVRVNINCMRVISVHAFVSACVRARACVRECLRV